jgi:hypothetical protein
VLAWPVAARENWFQRISDRDRQPGWDASRSPRSEAALRLGIPKIIHQTFRRAELPIQLAESVAALRGLNPGWEYRLYTDEQIPEFILDAYGAGMLAEYCKIDPAYGAARADLFRYLCLYQRGGVYLDIKSSAARPLDDVILADDAYLLSQWANRPGIAQRGMGMHRSLEHIPGGEYQQWFIVAAAEHPFLEAVVLRVLDNLRRYPWGAFGVGRRGVVALTGPIAYSLAIHPLLPRCPHRKLDISADAGFVYNIRGHKHEKTDDDFPVHYSRLRHPVVRMSLLRTCLWATLRVLRRSFSVATYYATRVWARPARF